MDRVVTTVPADCNRSGRVCYWTVADGDYAEMAKAVVASARSLGVQEDFHIWSDRSIPSAITHRAGDFDKTGWLFKFTFLRDAVQHLKYDCFVWLDTDTFFVRHPGDLSQLVCDSPMHIALESNILDPANYRKDWWGCRTEQIASLMRKKGVQSSEIWNVNGGLAIVHRDAVEAVYGCAMEFYTEALKEGLRLVDEPLWAFAMHSLCPSLEGHLLSATEHLWSSDWTGEFADRVPTHQPWTWTDYFNGARRQVNPAIVHAMRSKKALIEKGKQA